MSVHKDDGHMIAWHVRPYELRTQQKSAAFMHVAYTIAQLGTCDRKQVGCVIVRDGRCISWGFNGAPPGLPHCDENWHGWGVRDHQEGKADLITFIPNWRELALVSDDEHMPWDFSGGVDWLTRTRGCRNATHAEANALAAAAKQGISTDGGELFTTCSPCDTCSRLIIAAGIIRVYYMEEYRDRSGIELLRGASIECTQL